MYLTVEYGKSVFHSMTFGLSAAKHGRENSRIAQDFFMRGFYQPLTEKALSSQWLGIFLHPDPLVMFGLRHLFAAKV
jgi:hypothetical protein